MTTGPQEPLQGEKLMCSSITWVACPADCVRGAVRRALLTRSLALGLGAFAAAVAPVLAVAAAPFPPVFPLTSLTPAGGGDGSSGFTLRGPRSAGGAQLGHSAGTVGDLNG